MIGVFGGSFDPVHRGHIALATHVKNKLSLDKILLMPCANPAHKKQLLFNAAQRLTLLKLASKNKTFFSIDPRELKKKTISYTIDSLKSLNKDYPQETLCFIMGMDSFSAIKTWHCWQKLTTYCHLIVVARRGYLLNPQHLKNFHYCDDIKALKEKTGQLFIIDDFDMPVSSQRIKEKIKKNLDISDDVGYLLAQKIKTFVK